MGRHSQCKESFNASVKARRDANLEEARRKDRERYKGERAEKQRATAREHYRQNRERQMMLKRRYYEANRERFEVWRSRRNALIREVEHQPYTRREIYDRDGGECRICKKELTYGPG